MTKQALALLSFAIALTAASGPAQSAIVKGSDSAFTWTADTSTGLQWLDFDAGPGPSTINRSYLDVASELGLSGTYAGWRFATRSEVVTFILNVTGLPYLIFNGTSTQQDGATAMVAQWTGYTEASGVGTVPYLVHGFTADLYDSNPFDDNPMEGVYYMGLLDYFPDSRTQEYTVAVSSGVNADEIYQGFGSWLVRGGIPQSVPEPTSAWLSLLALVTLVHSRRQMRASVTATNCGVGHA